MSICLGKLLLLDSVLKDLLVEARATLDNIPPSITRRANADRLRFEYAKTRKKFENHVLNSVDALDANKLSRREFNRRMSGFFKYYYNAAYELGKETESHNARLTPKDAEWLEKEIDDEYKYSSSFANDILTQSGSMDYRSRAMMYVNALDSIYWKGMVSGLPEGTQIKWNFGDAEHCEDCVSLEDGSPYSIDTLPTYPRAGKTECLVNCKCFLTIFERE